RDDVRALEPRPGRVAGQDEAVHLAPSRRFDRVPCRRVAARAHGPGGVAQGRASRATLDQQLALLQGVPEEFGVRRRRRSQAVAHLSKASRSGLNLRMRKVCRPTTAPCSSRYVVTHVMKCPAPRRVRFLSEIDSSTIVDVMTSPRRRYRTISNS